MKGANVEGIPILGIDVWEHAPKMLTNSSSSPQNDDLTNSFVKI